MTDPIIEVKNLCFSVEDRKIIDRLSFSVPHGKIVAILGPSGTGKTTLLRLLTRQMFPDSGTIKVVGENIAKLKRSSLYGFRKRVGVLFQQSGLFTDLNVFDNVAFPLRELTQLKAVMVRDLVLLALQAVGLRGAKDLPISQLSGGMARRVALARSVVLGPELMFYDEPFVGQDPISCGVLVKLIQELNRSLGMTSIIISHNVKLVEQFVDEVFLLSGGAMIASGSPSKLKQSSQAHTRQFLNGLPDGPVPFHYPAQPLLEEMEL